MGAQRRHQRQDVLQPDDGVDARLEEGRRRALRDQNALVHGPIDVHEARQDVLAVKVKVTSFSVFRCSKQQSRRGIVL